MNWHRFACSAVFASLLAGCGAPAEESPSAATIDDDVSAPTGAYVPISRQVSDPADEAKELATLRQELSTTPPAPVVTHPEWAHLQGVMLRWPVRWPELKPTYLAMLPVLQTQGKVYIAVANKSAKNEAIADIQSCADCSLTNLEWVTGRTDSIWMRDYGPEFMYAGPGSTLSLVDLYYSKQRRNDDAFPQVFAHAYDMDLYAPNLKLSGGNFQTDGAGNCFTSRYTAEVNGEEFTRTAFHDYFGCMNTYFVDYLAEEGTHHIDMWMHFLTPTTVIVGDHSYYGNETLSYPDDENDVTLQGVANYLAGLGYNVVRIPQPLSRTSPFGGYTIVTYTNSNIVNDRVLVPVYGLATDATALGIYESVLPASVQAVGIDSNYIIDYGGAMHCITMEKHP